MSTNWWVEMSLLVSSSSGADLVEFVEALAEAIEKDHDGHVMYTFASSTGHLTLAMTTVSSEETMQVCAKVSGTVRSAAHGLRAHTPGWPETPVSLSDFIGFSIRPLESESETVDA